MSRQSIVGMLKNDILPKFLCIVTGTTVYRLSLPVMDINVTHATSTLGLNEIPSRIPVVIAQSFKHFIVSQPEFQPFTKLLLLSAVILAAANLLLRSTKVTSETRHKLIRSAIILFLLFGLVVATKAMFLVSDNGNFFDYRYNLSLGFLYGFAFLTLFAFPAFELLVPLSIALAFVVAVRFLQADLIRQGVLLRGETHDLALANRILYRIESLPDIDFEKRYLLVRVGNYPSFRMNALRSHGHNFQTNGSWHMDSGEITAHFSPSSVMEMLGSSVKFKTNGFNPTFKEDEAAARKQIELENRKPWPHSSSVFVSGDRIIVYMR
jgi:hypothetical protein